MALPPSPLRGSILAVAAVWRPPNRFPLRPAQREGEGQGEVGPMLCAQHQNIPPGFTERTLALRALRQVSARFCPQPGADSSVCYGSNRSASATQISLQHRSFRLRKSGETALKTPAVPK